MFKHLYIFYSTQYIVEILPQEMTYHIVGPGDEVGPPLDVGDGALPLMQHTRLPAVQPITLIQEQLWTTGISKTTLWHQVQHVTIGAYTAFMSADNV